MTYNSLLKKVFIINTFLLSCIAVPAQVMWNLKGGFMPVSEQHVNRDSESTINWMAGIEIEIPLSQKLNIETGLRYKHSTLCLTGLSEEYDITNHLEIPIRLTYKYKLRDNLSLHAGIGPYLGCGLKGGVRPEVGIEPSVALNWKSISLGLSYTNLLYIDKGNFDKYKNNSGLMLTFGYRFRSDKWKYVGAGLAAAGAVAGTIYAVSQGSNSDNSYAQNSSRDTDSSEYSIDRSSSINKKSKSKENSSSTNITSKESINWQREKAIYDDYDTKLSNMQTHNSPFDGFNDKDRIDFQKEMKRIRLKWEKKGYQMTKSPREDWDGR